MFPFCSNEDMVKAAIQAGTPTAASPATDEADTTMLSELAGLAMELARAFQARAVAAIQADDLDRAGKAEASFNRTALGIRRAVALKARLREQKEEERRKADAHRHRLQGRKDDRRHAVAQGVSRAIAVVKPEAQERLTADLWLRLTETDRIDADLADTALPIETLVLRLGREIGLSHRAIAYGLDPARAKARAEQAAAGPKPWDEVPAAGPTRVTPGPPHRPGESSHWHSIPAEDVGGPEGERYFHNIINGEIYNQSWELVRTLPADDRPDPPPPPDPAVTAPPDPPPDRPLPSDRRQWTDADLAEHRRRESERGAQWRHWQLFQRIHQQG
jgi:hypothetical protein